MLSFVAALALTFASPGAWAAAPGMLSLAPGSATPTVQCGPASAMAAGRGRLAVRVVAAEGGAVVEGATVYVSNDPYSKELRTDAKGLARLADLGAGEYLVLTTHDLGDAQAVIKISEREQCLVTFSLGAPPPSPSQRMAEQRAERENVELDEAASDPDAIARYQASKEKGQTLRGAGIGVLTLGGALVVGAPLAWMVGPCGSDGANTPDCSGDTRTQLVVGFAVAGGVTMAGGIAMMIVGARKTKNARRAISATALPTRGGAHVSLQGRF